MEISDKLDKYFAGDLSYQESVDLFFTVYPEKRDALENFLAAEDEFSRKKIRTGLEEKRDELARIPEQNKYHSFTVPKHQANPLDVSKLPEVLRKEHARLSPVIRELSEHHSLLRYEKLTNAERLAICNKMMPLIRERRRIWTRIDHFTETGVILDAITHSPEPIDYSRARDFEKEDKIRKLMSRRSKAKIKGDIAIFNALDEEIKSLRTTRYI